MKLRIGLACLLAAACASSAPEGEGAGPQGAPGPGQRRGGGPPQRRLPAQLPDTTGWGVHVLALGVDPGGSLWAGTYGKGIFVLRSGSNQWEHISPVAGDSTSISWGFVNSFAFPEDGSIWYGTVGNGWGRSVDEGGTWRNWTIGQLGPEWQYVAHNGMASRGDTVAIAKRTGVPLE